MPFRVRAPLALAALVAVAACGFEPSSRPAEPGIAGQFVATSAAAPAEVGDAAEYRLAIMPTRSRQRPTRNDWA